MKCEYCKGHKSFETKPCFKYKTQIYKNHIIVSKKKLSIIPLIKKARMKLDFGTDFGMDFNRYVALYMNDIKYCPMCGRELEGERNENC